MKPTKLITIFFTFLFVTALHFNASAQHCPFDGASLIVVHLTDATNQPILTPGNLTLREIENPQADQCTYAKGILLKPFWSVDKALKGESEYARYYENWQMKYCTGCTFLGDGYYAVKLNQAESTCMIKSGENDFSYKKRLFEVDFGNKEQPQTIKVDEENIYKLCTASGKWLRIVPIEINVIKAS